MSAPIRLQHGRRVARHRSSRPTRLAVLAVAFGAGIAAVPVDARPTGSGIGDVLFTFAFAALAAGAGSYARRWTWPLLAGAAALVADGTTMVIVVAFAVAAAVVGLARSRRDRILGALVGALAVQVLLRQPAADTDTYLPSLIAAVAVAPMLASAYHNGPNRLRRRVHLTAAGFAVWFIVGAVGLGIAANRARSDVRTAIDLAIDGLDAAEQAEQEQATQLLRQAASGFEVASDDLSSPLALPARLLPILGNNFNALDVATEHGARLTRTAAATAEQVDLDDLAFRNGRIDIGTLVRISDPLEAAATAAENALVAVGDADSPWLLGPVDTRLEQLIDELDTAAPSLRNAAEVVHVAPSLLGGEGDRIYLVLFITPSELRGLGGFVGGFAELRASNGTLELTRTGRPAELNETLENSGATIDGPADYVDLWGQYQPERFFQDITLSPHFPAVADVAAQLYQQAAAVSVDGVLALDPTALAALTEFTGPIEVAGVRLAGRDLADFLLHDQYLDFANDEEAREDLLDAALRTVFTELFMIDTPSPRAVARVLGPVVDEGRLMFVAADGADQAVLERLGISGALPNADGSDLIGVVAQNAANNKIDWFLRRSIAYTAVVADNGRLDATVSIEMTNTAPSGGGELPLSVIGSNDRGLELGLSRSAITVYTPHRFESARVDGVEIGTRQGQERGLNTYSFTIDISAGQTRTLEVTLLGALDEPDHYRLTVAPQPTAHPDRYVIEVSAPNGQRLTRELLTPADVSLIAN